MANISAQPYVHTDGRALHVGRRYVSPLNVNTLYMSKHAALLPPAPMAIDYTRGITAFGEMGNDVLSDCCEAAYGHATQIVSLNTPMGMVTPADQLIINFYGDSSGYVIGDASTDNGSVISWVLNYALKYSLAARRKHPRVHAASQLHAYGYVDPLNLPLVQQSIATFGVLDIGLALPITCQAQIGTLWDVVGNPATDPNSMPNSWGGHSTVVVGYRTVDSVVQLLTITWGALQWMTTAFWNAYVDESFALMFTQWLVQFGAQFAPLISAIDAELSLIT
jgi:hypothetical protein